MKKQLLLGLSFCILLSTVKTNAQTFNKWYENSSSTENIIFESALKSTFTTDVANPLTDGINTNATVSKLTREDSPTNATNQVVFNLSPNVTKLSDLQIKMKIFVTNPADATADIDVKSRRVRVYLRNSADTSKQIYLQSVLTTAKAWQELTFDFSGTLSGATDEAAALAANGGFFNTFAVLVSAGNNDGVVLDYYIDTIEATIVQDPSTASVDDNLLADNFKLYPTRVSNKFETTENVKSAEVFTILGQKVMSFQNQKEFDATSLNAGLYLFRAQLENGASKTLRFIKE